MHGHLGTMATVGEIHNEGMYRLEAGRAQRCTNVAGVCPSNCLTHARRLDGTLSILCLTLRTLDWWNVVEHVSPYTWANLGVISALGLCVIGAGW